MRLESRQSHTVLRVGGLLLFVIALVAVVVTGGAALAQALLPLAVGGYFAWRPVVEVVALSQHFHTLHITRSRLFSSTTQKFPLQDLTARYDVRGSLRSPRHQVLQIQHRGRVIAELSPKEGFTAVDIERFHAALIACQAQDSSQSHS